MRAGLNSSTEVLTMPGRDDSQAEGVGSIKDDTGDSASLPCNTDASILMSFRPEKIEEECCAKDECDEDSGKDVV